MKIRDAVPAELPAIIELLEQADLPTEDVADQQHGFLVAVDRNACLLGAGGLEVCGGDGLLRSLVVAPSHRHAGIASELCNALLERAVRRGLRTVFLLTNDADGYFERLDFEVIERDTAPPSIRATREFSRLCPQSAIFMRKELDASVLPAAGTNPSAGNPGSPTDDRLIALAAYEELAESYAAAIDTKPHNAYYERPATLSLLPDVRDLRVLDAGCGPGVYMEWLLERGAQVIGIDASPKMIELARQRVGSRAAIRQADIAEPLVFLDDGSFHLVLSALALDYLRDWDRVFREFHRLLAPSGYLVFSVGHPVADLLLSGTQRYFEIERIEYEWTDFGSSPVQMPCYRRPLSALINPLVDAGFVLDRVIEPVPTEAFRLALPADYEELRRRPGFICVRARKARD